MAKRYRKGLGTRLANLVFSAMTRLGLGRRERQVLSVRGRRTGSVHSVPVNVIGGDGRRFLVAAYGPVEWVKNARAAGEVTLTRGGRSETARVVELEPDESVPVLRKYLREVPIVRPYFDATGDSSDDEFRAEAVRHPVFRIEPAPTGTDAA